MRSVIRYGLWIAICACGYAWAQGAPMIDSGVLETLASIFAQSKAYIQHLVEQTNTPLLRTCIIFVLGLLMSLTPCIYPMIPITLGTLQAAAGKAKHNTFILALLYTCGIAVTFAILGLLAAFGGTQLGTLLGNPWFIIPFVIFLGYLAFAMMGLYELYIPRFLQQQTALSRTGGAYISAFIFGMLNGSVASPCVSPGLVMVLSIVAKLQSILLGFLYLFAFGFGLGLPLLIIGSFSQAATLMPKAGMWMIEVKRIFGILLLSMAWYYASNIMSPSLSLWIAAGAALSIALVYLYVISQGTGTWHTIWSGIMILASLVVAAACVTYLFTSTYEMAQDTLQLEQNYERARKKAQTEQKLLLLDFGANWCTLCKEIERTLLHSEAVHNSGVVIAHVDCTYTGDDYSNRLQERYGVQMVPTLLLVDPERETVIKRWHGELTDYTPQAFVELLTMYGVRA